MSFLHKLRIYAPDGIGATATVLLDGEQIFPQSVYLRCDGNIVGAQITFETVALEFDGLSEVTA